MILFHRGGLGWLAAVLTLSLWGSSPPAAVKRTDTGRTVQDSVTQQKAIEAGRGIFHGQGTCFGCHGAKLEGTAIAPTLRAHKWRNGDGSLEMILKVIHNGVPNTAMVSHPGGINEAQIQQVAAYVFAVSHGAAQP
jgi:mono/diheme cytochrome c family protein